MFSFEENSSLSNGVTHLPAVLLVTTIRLVCGWNNHGSVRIEQ